MRMHNMCVWDDENQEERIGCDNDGFGGWFHY